MHLQTHTLTVSGTYISLLSLYDNQTISYIFWGQLLKEMGLKQMGFVYIYIYIYIYIFFFSPVLFVGFC